MGGLTEGPRDPTHSTPSLLFHCPLSALVPEFRPRGHPTFLFCFPIPILGLSSTSFLTGKPPLFGGKEKLQGQCGKEAARNLKPREQPREGGAASWQLHLGAPDQTLAARGLDRPIEAGEGARRASTATPTPGDGRKPEPTPRPPLNPVLTLKSAAVFSAQPSPGSQSSG